MHTYIAFLRGINVGGKHLVPMRKLKEILSENSFSDVKTLLNSGNVIFNHLNSSKEKLTLELETILKKEFAFEIPCFLITKQEFLEIISLDPFKKEEINQNLRFYITFSKNTILEESIINNDLKGIKIISTNSNFICFVLDLTEKNSTKAMITLEKILGREVTTRNMNTILKLSQNLN